MNLPNQTKAVAHKTYNANAVTTGVHASATLTPMMSRLLFPQLGL